MKKSKITGDIAVMEVSHQSKVGSSRTRAAKTLALQRLLRTTTSSSPSAQVVASTSDVSSFSYLQLRSRRLEKLPSPVSNGTKQRQQAKQSSFREEEEEEEEEKKKKKNGENKREGCFGKREIVMGVGRRCGIEEASFGDHNLDFDLRDRSTRESSTCSLINDFKTIAAPGSTTTPRSCPLTYEMEEFFAFAEQQQQRNFIEKYNFDIVNDLPLPGRYEWVKVIP